jgi:flavin-dependent dehydrogenase
MQARIKINQTPNQYQVFLGKEYGTFSWIVPECNNISKIGIITKNNKEFQNLIKKFDGKILDYPSGPIPIYKKIKLQKNNIFIVGDAAAQIKNTTGGGIIYGLLSAQCLAKSIIKRQNYQKLFNKKIKKSLFLHNLIYKIMKKFKDEDYDKLIKLCKKPKIKSIIEDSDREHPINMITKIILKEPRFLLFLGKIMRKL